MPTIIFGVLVLALALWVLGVIAKVDPKIAARVLKASGGILAIGFAVFLGLRGEVGIAIPLGIFGLGLLGWIPFGPAGFSQRTQKSAGQTSHVRSAYLEMELDHDSGAMRGRIVAGRHQGTALERLDVKTPGPGRQLGGGPRRLRPPAGRDDRRGGDEADVRAGQPLRDRRLRLIAGPGGSVRAH